ncbi:MAG TPA: ATP-dependent DNA ligase [Acidimicrobiales bacterium]|nr:ATP-dependent DNA ligase [Acidimicrobiales bacterium]
MDTPVKPPVQPMLAKSLPAIPVGEEWRYEPKWDGFRSIIFRHGDDVELGSRNAKPLTRYFPEVVEHVRAAFPQDAVVDGELVIVGDDGAVDFDLLSLRVHPAESRVTRLRNEIPALFVAFDLLAIDGQDITSEAFDQRRGRLIEALHGRGKGIYVTPMTTDPDEAQVWFDRWEGAGLDGVMAKKGDDVYHPGLRTMVKVKHERTIDCVVAGFRWHKDGKGIGSLLLGLYDEAGNLHHIGVTGSFTAAKRTELVDELAPLREKAGENHPWKEWANLSASGSDKPPTGNRWNAKKDMSWEPLRTELVIEVAYGHFQGGSRMRHAASFRRFRPDRDPQSCTYEQVQPPDTVSIAEVLAST